MLCVGAELKGQTETILKSIDEMDDWSWTFEGGLDNVVANMTDTIILQFLDFREEKQGIRLVLWMNGCKSWVFQAGVVT